MRFAASIPIRRVALWPILLGLIVLLAGVGCGPNLDAEDPSGGYNLYRQGLIEGDADQVWSRLDQRSRAYFQRRYEQLEQMDRTIEEYLPPADHQLARKQSGTVLLDEIDGPKGLFKRVVDFEKLRHTRATELGSLVGTVRIAKNKETAKVETRGGRTYTVVKRDGEWYVNLIDSVPAVDESFQWLEKNKKALDKTVESRMEEERQRREEIIARLFNVDGG